MRASALSAGIAVICLWSGGPSAAEEGDRLSYAPGEKLTLVNCGRCHVVSERNRMGGIGSTPSFAVMRGRENWEARMRVFWTEPPHIAFTQIEGVTPPFPANRPSPIHPVELTLDEIDRIIDYARTLEPPDLGEMPVR